MFDLKKLELGVIECTDESACLENFEETKLESREHMVKLKKF